MADRKVIDYGALENAAAFYDNKAQELRDSILTQVRNKNNEIVGSSWISDTATRFQARFEEDHARALETVAEALNDVAKYIRAYVDVERTHDQGNASSI